MQRKRGMVSRETVLGSSADALTNAQTRNFRKADRQEPLGRSRPLERFGDRGAPQPHFLFKVCFSHFLWCCRHRRNRRLKRQFRHLGSSCMFSQTEDARDKEDRSEHRYADESLVHSPNENFVSYMHSQIHLVMWPTG